PADEQHRGARRPRGLDVAKLLVLQRAPDQHVGVLHRRTLGAVARDRKPKPDILTAVMLKGDDDGPTRVELRRESPLPRLDPQHGPEVAVWDVEQFRVRSEEAPVALEEPVPATRECRRAKVESTPAYPGPNAAHVPRFLPLRLGHPVEL